MLEQVDWITLLCFCCALAYHVLLFLLLLFQRHRKLNPTWQKGQIVPYLFLFNFATTALVYILTAIPVISQYRCVMFQFGVFLLSLTNYILFSSSAILYLIRMNVQRQRIKVHEDRSNAQMLRIYSVMERRIIYVVLWFVVIVSYLVFLSTAYWKNMGAVDNFFAQCDAFRKTTRIIGMLYALTIIIVFACAMMVIYWWDRKEIVKCDLKSLFFTNDASMVKLEMTANLLGSIVSSIAISILFVLKLGNTDIPFHMVSLFSSIWSTSSFPGISIIVSFYNSRKTIQEYEAIDFEPTVPGTLKLLNDSNIRTRFIHFAKCHFCVELLFFIVCACNLVPTLRLMLMNLSVHQWKKDTYWPNRYTSITCCQILIL